MKLAGVAPTSRPPVMGRPWAAGLLLGVALLLGACAPRSTGGATSGPLPCVTTPPPALLVLGFAPATLATGPAVSGVEDAAAARLRELLAESTCYVIVDAGERRATPVGSATDRDPAMELARERGADFLVTGSVDRVELRLPGSSLFGVSVGEARALVQLTVTVTHVATGHVAVVGNSVGEATSSAVAPGGPELTLAIDVDDPALDDVMRVATNAAVSRMVSQVRARL